MVTKGTPRSLFISTINDLRNKIDGITSVSSPPLLGNEPHSHAISDVTDLTSQLSGKADSSHSHAISDITGLSVQLSAMAGNVRTTVLIESDFYSAGVDTIPGITGAAISSGTVGVVAADANHPGVIYLRDSTTANGGYRFLTDASSFKISGGEIAHFIFMPRGIRAASSFRLGWQDSTAIQTQPTDGIWFQCTGNATNMQLLGRIKNNAGPTDTSTINLTNNAWYYGKITVNAGATSVNFTVYNASGTIVLNEDKTTNIPTAAGRETGFGVIAGETSTDAAADIVHMDYIKMEISRTLQRGEGW